ncbi:unnamed protein product [Clavelina lepadiformis]|uniref:Uncharacterized protein n=1 Tax=Clavelina lepadiformis TaxID=159417 RepID=A0ABP0FW36_CLALP
MIMPLFCRRLILACYIMHLPCEQVYTHISDPPAAWQPDKEPTEEHLLVDAVTSAPNAFVSADQKKSFKQTKLKSRETALSDSFMKLATAVRQ